MFGRDPVLPLNTLLEPKIRYLGNDVNVLSLELMKNMFEIAATNLRLARERGDPKDNPLPSKLQPGDTVLIQNHIKGPFDPKYKGDYRVVSLKWNQVEVLCKAIAVLVSYSYMSKVYLHLISNSHIAYTYSAHLQVC